MKITAQDMINATRGESKKIIEKESKTIIENIENELLEIKNNHTDKNFCTLDINYLNKSNISKYKQEIINNVLIDLNKNNFKSEFRKGTNRDPREMFDYGTPDIIVVEW